MISSKKLKDYEDKDFNTHSFPENIINFPQSQRKNIEWIRPKVNEFLF
jgi:hypothetical protein